jgi:MoaA/NifB/PqqE/SkfB family radical SAM enzyme
VFASVVMTPSAFADFPRVEQSFTALGVPLIPKAIRGPYGGRWYPQAYTKAERAQFRRYSEQTELTREASSRLPDRHGATVNPLLDRDYLDGLPDFTGILCSAGRRFVSIDYDGVIRRCGLKTVLGNLLERRLDLLSEDRPCDDEYCPYWCIRYSRFENHGPASYRRRRVPSGFQQPLVTLRGMRRDIGNRIATLFQPRP